MSSNSVTFDTSRADFEPYGVTCLNWQPTVMPRPDHHNEIELNYLRSGSMTYLLGEKKCTVEAGKFCIFWGAIPHQVIEYEGDEPYMAATIPLQNFLHWRLPQEFVRSLMQGALLSEAQASDSEFDTYIFERWINDLAERPNEAEQLVLLEIQARLTRMANDMTIFTSAEAEKLAGVSQSGLSKVEQMACYIAQYYTQKITVQQVADLVGLKPNYAMSLFQKAFGATLINHLTKHRLSHAQRMLCTTEDSITDIALQSGFQSISRFNDVFSQTFGCSPRNYRKLRCPI